MIFAFTLIGAICIRGFVTADTVSRNRQAQDEAVRVAQNAAELLKASCGDFETVANRLSGVCREDGAEIWYTEHWEPTREKSKTAYRLNVQREEESLPLLEKATVRVYREREILFSLSVAWQEG